MDGFRIDRSTDPVTLRCPAVEIGPWRGGFSTRVGQGGAAFDLRLASDGASPGAEARRDRFLEAVGLAGVVLTEVRQVHGDRVLRESEVGPGSEADALILDGGDRGRAVGVRTTDCVPVLLVDPDGRAAAAVHAGWRGVAAGVVPATVRALAARGVDPAAVEAAVGPSIGACCYRVDPDCAARVEAACPAGPGAVSADAVVRAGPDGPRVDLRGGVGRQLRAAGLDPDRIRIAPWCTRCRPDLLFSHRGEGPGAGRMLAVLGVPAVAVGGRS